MRRYGVFALAAVAAVLVAAELSLSLPLLGSGPDLLLITTIAFVAGERPMRAAWLGFGAGVFRDALLLSPAGPSAFAYGVTSYAVATAGAVRGVGAFVALVAGATFLSQILHGLGVQIVSPAASASMLPRVAISVTVYNALLTPLLMPLLRRFATADQPAKEVATP